MNRSLVLPWCCMGSPISPLIANLFMEEFEVKALSSCPHPPSLWLRFVDDNFVTTEAENSKTLLQHINNRDPHILFTVEEPSQQGRLPFLDTLVTMQPNNTFTTMCYRKPTHTDQYLHWESNHFITTKQSVYNTLARRATSGLIKPRSIRPRTVTHQEGSPGMPFSKLGFKPITSQVQRKQPSQSTKQQQQPN